MLSFLTPLSADGSAPAVLGYTNWDVKTEPTSCEDRDELLDIMRGIACRDWTTGEPDGYRFVGYRRPLAGLPGEWNLTPAFVEYFQLRRNAETDWVDPYSGGVVVRIPSSNAGSRAEMRTDYLRDFLGATGMVLVRQFDLARHWDSGTSAHSIEVRTEDVVTEWGCYWLDLVPNPGPDAGAFSRLVAKDFVLPSPTPRTVGGVHEAPADPSLVPPFWLLGGSSEAPARRVPSVSRFFEIALFRRAVLQRYYDDPDRYTVKVHAYGMGSLNYMGVWALPFSINREDLVVVWAGDLVKQGLPMHEISHWHAHNVRPRGGLSEQFVRSQLMAEFPDTPSLEERLLECRSVLVSRLRELNCPFYAPYSGPDVHAEKQIRRPTEDTTAEFAKTILALARAFIEYLDDGAITQALRPEAASEGGKQQEGPIVKLARALELRAQVGPAAAGGLKAAL